MTHPSTIRTSTTSLAVAATTVLATLWGASTGVANAAGATAAPSAVGTERAAATPWAVQLVSDVESVNGSGVTPLHCSAAQISAEWVLTSRFCVDDGHLPKGHITGTTVYQSNSVSDPGTGREVDRVVIAPTGDIALLHVPSLDRPTSYAQIDLDHTSARAGNATALGFGGGTDGERPTGLTRTVVGLSGQTTDAYDGVGQLVSGVRGGTGAGVGAEGGPLLVDGRVVAVRSVGAEGPFGSGAEHAAYSLLSQNAGWIRSIVGLI